MEEKKYLKWYNKIGYGSGDIAGNVVYAFLTSFMMVYLTDSVGLAAGVVGTLIAVSKLFDGFTDIFFGSMIDKTHIKWEKRSHGCYTDTLVVPLRWSAALQYQSALEQRLNTHGSLSLIHCEMVCFIQQTILLTQHLRH